MELMGRTIEEIQVGEKSGIQKTVTEADILLFGAVTTDMNPAHFNEVYAAGTFFKKRIAHGMLTGGFVSAVLGMKLPGPGTIYVSQNCKFTAPVFIGDTITAWVEVKEKIADKNRLVLRTWCENQDGKTVLDGEAVVMPPKRKV